jgi:metallo-beta-lactamase family protein
MSVTIQFLGAAGTVTGSKYLVRSSTNNILVDCGMFQGEPKWRDENWSLPPFELRSIDAVLITHAHLDHIGVLPRFVAQGMHAPIYCSKPTAELMPLMLLDSGRLQEEEAQYRAERGRSRFSPPLPLYTEEDARVATSDLKAVEMHTRTEICAGVFAEWRPAGHLLGAASIVLEIEGTRIIFSGDIGRYGAPVMVDPETPGGGDLVLVESTYG